MPHVIYNVYPSIADVGPSPCPSSFSAVCKNGAVPGAEVPVCSNLNERRRLGAEASVCTPLACSNGAHF
jgi:hypothetical protein